MNCSTCRYELSQCLDGRLPSGRRTVVLQHAESCAVCGAFWNELQQAQQLTLSLRETPVSSDFREGLWARIRAGEGSPNAVFHETVSTGTKLRYLLTGAAAAAVLLLGVTYMRGLPGLGDHQSPHDAAVASSDDISTTQVADGPAEDGANIPVASRIATPNSGLQPRRAQPVDTTLATFAGSAPLVTPQPLTLNVLAMETARQLEDSFAEVSADLRVLRSSPPNRGAASHRVLRSARELHAFGELLLELRERKRVHFSDHETDLDLQFAVHMLASASKHKSDGTNADELVESYVEPALRRNRLATLSDTILVRQVRDERQELEYLMQLNRIRPEVFPKLFVPLGDQTSFVEELSLINPGFAFSMNGACGPAWVAPRSEMNRIALRILVEHR